MPGERIEPLRSHDPRALGTYQLVGRLGEGGMGTVYLARSEAGVLVAVKVVRADLAPDDEFRRRFRSEVARARQVPPFCTAEVLDADPDHERPYFVVEYVDGPTLADVVEERGPLTAANLHSVAIGVATALTAIHGAGVIHRDLKPRNVLLAPGSPKVIDFGIARAMEAPGDNTAAGQMVGTVAYMAPERFGDEALSAASDVFAWGGVVTYAGTGRTPFGGDSPPATAGRILTQEPDLTGLAGGLRELVAAALAKDPADRPTARELLDQLVSGPHRPAATVAALDDQPVLRAAAREAQAVTGLAPVPNGLTPAESEPAPAADGRKAAATSEEAGPGFGTAGLIGYDEDSIITQQVLAGAVPMVDGPPDEPRKQWFLPFAVALLVLAVVTGAAMLVLAPLVDRSSAASVVAEQPPDLADDLVQARLWVPTSAPDGRSSCDFEGSLTARVLAHGLYKCRGPQDNLPRDLNVAVNVRLLTSGACAAVWFRFTQNRGYQLQVCRSSFYLGTHKGKVVEVIRTFPLDDPIDVGGRSVRIGLVAVDGTLEVTRDGNRVGTVALTDPEMTGSRLLLGVYTDRGAPATGPFSVAFDHIEVRYLGER